MAQGSHGTLFLIVGPSGVGKDTLIDGAKAQLAGDPRYHFVTRTITRPPEAGGEVHVPVDEAGFAAIAGSGGFALSWQAHGLSYGIPDEVRERLAGGQHVIANVSRSVLDSARETLAPVVIVSVSASSDAINRRLRARGRETGAAIEERIARAAAYEVSGPGVIELSNDGTVEAAIAQLLAILEAS